MSDITRIYIWRNRARGFLVVTAKSLDDAREIAAAKVPTWATYAAQHEPSGVMLARAGEATELKQR